MAFRDSYVAINGALVFVLLLIFSYSFFYPVLASQGLTIHSLCEGLPEIYCRSRGLSRAFYRIMHFNLEKAAVLNKYALKLFIFFMIQFFARIFLSVLYLKTKNSKLIIWDSTLSAIYFIYVFFPLTFLYYWLWER